MSTPEEWNNDVVAKINAATKISEALAIFYDAHKLSWLDTGDNRVVLNNQIAAIIDDLGSKLKNGDLSKEQLPAIVSQILPRIKSELIMAHSHSLDANKIYTHQSIENFNSELNYESVVSNIVADSKYLRDQMIVDWMIATNMLWNSEELKDTTARPMYKNTYEHVAIAEWTTDIDLLYSQAKALDKIWDWKAEQEEFRRLREANPWLGENIGTLTNQLNAISSGITDVNVKESITKKIEYLDAIKVYLFGDRTLDLWEAAMSLNTSLGEIYSSEKWPYTVWISKKEKLYVDFTDQAMALRAIIHTKATLDWLDELASADNLYDAKEFFYDDLLSNLTAEELLWIWTGIVAVGGIVWWIVVYNNSVLHSWIADVEQRDHQDELQKYMDSLYLEEWYDKKKMNDSLADMKGTSDEKGSNHAHAREVHWAYSHAWSRIWRSLGIKSVGWVIWELWLSRVLRFRKWRWTTMMWPIWSSLWWLKSSIIEKRKINEHFEKVAIALWISEKEYKGMLRETISIWGGWYNIKQSTNRIYKRLWKSLSAYLEEKWLKGMKLSADDMRSLISSGLDVEKISWFEEIEWIIKYVEIWDEAESRLSLLNRVTAFAKWTDWSYKSEISSHIFDILPLEYKKVFKNFSDLERFYNDNISLQRVDLTDSLKMDLRGEVGSALSDMWLDSWEKHLIEANLKRLLDWNGTTTWYALKENIRMILLGWEYNSETGIIEILSSDGKNISHLPRLDWYQEIINNTTVSNSSSTQSDIIREIVRSAWSEISITQNLKEALKDGVTESYMGSIKDFLKNEYLLDDKQATLELAAELERLESDLSDLKDWKTSSIIFWWSEVKDIWELHMRLAAIVHIVDPSILNWKTFKLWMAELENRNKSFRDGYLIQDWLLIIWDQPNQTAANINDLIRNKEILKRLKEFQTLWGATSYFRRKNLIKELWELWFSDDLSSENVNVSLMESKVTLEVGKIIHLLQEVDPSISHIDEPKDLWNKLSRKEKVTPIDYNQRLKEESEKTVIREASKIFVDPLLEESFNGFEEQKVDEMRSQLAQLDEITKADGVDLQEFDKKLKAMLSVEDEINQLVDTWKLNKETVESIMGEAKQRYEWELHTLKDTLISTAAINGKDIPSDVGTKIYVDLNSLVFDFKTVFWDEGTINERLSLTKMWLTWNEQATLMKDFAKYKWVKDIPRPIQKKLSDYAKANLGDGEWVWHIIKQLKAKSFF